LKRAVFLLGTLEVEAVKNRRPLTDRTLADLVKLSDDHGVEAEIMFAVQDEMQAGRSKTDIKIGPIRAERPRVLEEIRLADPDFVLMFGPVAAASLFDQGNLSEDNLCRRLHFPLGDDLPCYYTYSLENLHNSAGLRQWWDLDLGQAVKGADFETEWGDYQIVMPSTEIQRWSGWHGHWDPLKSLDIHPDYFTEGVIGFDLETYPGTNPWHPEARIRMAVISDQVGRAWVVQATPESGFPSWIEDLLTNPRIVKCGSNIGFDYCWMRRFGVRVQNMWDTGITEHVIDESNPKKGLKHLAYKYVDKLGDYARGHLELVKARRIKGVSDGWDQVRDDEQYEYAGGDGEASIGAYYGQLPQIEGELERPWRLSHKVHDVFCEIEHNGSCISLAENRRLDRVYMDRMSEVRQKITAVLGPINLNSPPQLADALQKLVPHIRLTRYDWRRVVGDEEGIEISTKREILERESHKHPVIHDILEYRKYSKRHGTFIQGVHDNHLVSHHGCHFIHPSYRLDTTETFRPSSRDPNGQNFPTKENDPDLSIKRQFVSRFDGGQILEVDQSQIELRFAAWVSQDADMVAAIQSGEDIHRSMAAALLNKRPEDVTDTERYECKTRTFLILYGGGAKKLGADLKIPTDEARRMMNEYFARFRGLKAYIDKVHREVREDLEVVTHFGYRRRFVPPLAWRHREGYRIQRQAFNTYVQNGAACLTYCAMIWMQNELEWRGLRSKMCQQIHDSVLFDVHPDEVEEIKRTAKHGMEIACVELARKEFGVNFTLPLKADIKIGESWGSASEMT
jgi:DNA polymerase-1